MVGRLLGGRYELLEKIGGGGMAIVYKAKCHLLKRFVAVKILRPELVEDEEFVSRFKRESQAAASLSHPNIVNIYDVGEEDDIHYIVMEYVKGKTLKEYIKQSHHFDAQSAIDICIQICSAIKHAHEHNIIHRDIKPQNILVGDDGSIKVTDFGIARAVNSSTVTIAGANVIGSVHYFSPEQARGGYVDEKSDLYSLGIVLYEMMTGTVPFEGDTAISVALKHIQEKVKPPGELNPDIPKSLQNIIEKAIEKEQSKRYQSAEEMISDLKKSLKDPDGDFVVRNIDSDTPTQVIPRIEIEQEADEDSISRHKKRRWPKILAVLIPALLILALSFYIGNRIYRNNFIVKEVEVPDITKISEEEAKALLEEKGLAINVIGRKNNKEINEGHIISQDPGANMKVKVPSVVNVYVSLGPRTITVPDVVGKNERKAIVELENSGLQVEPCQYQYNDQYPAGIVISQSIPDKTEVTDHASITLVVSSGPKTQVVKVGNYAGVMQDVAKDLIKSDGFEIGNIYKEYNETVPKGAVIKQKPEAGVYVEKNRGVSIWVSLGPKTNFPKKLQIPLPALEDKDTVRVRVERADTGEVQYDNEHNISEKEIFVELKGKDVVDFIVYIDGEYVKKVTVDFTKQEENAQ